MLTIANKIPFPQLCDVVAVNLNTADATMDGSGAGTVLLYTAPSGAGDAGVVITEIVAWTKITCVLTPVRLFISPDGIVAKKYLKEKAIPATTVNTTSGNTGVAILVDPSAVPAQPLRLPAGAKLWGAIAVAGDVNVVMQIGKYQQA